nr:solute carrier family 35 member F1-like isoform X1 [Ipomoea batatas]
MDVTVVGTHGKRIQRTLYLLFLGQVISFVEVTHELLFFSVSHSWKSGYSITLSLLRVYLALFSVILKHLYLPAARNLQYAASSSLIRVVRDLLMSKAIFGALVVIATGVQIDVNQAFQYSSITSVTILDCWTIAWLILLDMVFPGTRYSPMQYFGLLSGGEGLDLEFSLGRSGGRRCLLEADCLFELLNAHRMWRWRSECGNGDLRQSELGSGDD